ncbi:hypothetical protein NIES4102_22140 [Chondrocystis sp. NIES-4102]|nr:hypothetical protein NIES4102_22140 [Chondrocystis sp. NIES-4102]
MTIMIGSSKGYPTKWSNYCEYYCNNQTELSGFVGEHGNINRFAARFRAANCFKEVCFDGYSEVTNNGYSALCRVMLTWSAFETFMIITGIQQNNLREILDARRANDILNQIRAIDRESRFYNFIYKRVNSIHKSELNNYLNQDPCNITYLASAIRHIFAHGWLSPNANQVNPNIVVEICDLLHQFLLSFMDIEFSTYLDKALKEFTRSE